MRRGLFLLSCLLLIGMLGPGSARATRSEMWSLPTYEPARCLTCHTSSESALDNDPSLATQLNPFGVDWNSLGRVWNEQIAKRDSDGDQCINGAELGDYTGTQWTGPYVEDPTRNEQNSNPGVVDCTRASINDRSWGILKAVFGESNKFKYR